MAKLEHRQHFGIPVFATKLPAYDHHRQGLLDFFDVLRGERGDRVHRSNQGGWHSEENLYQLDNENTQWLAKRIVQIAAQGIKEVAKTDVKVQMVAMWANINEAGDWNAPHHHLPADWSGVFWAKTEIEKRDKRGKKDKKVRDGDLLLFDPLPMARRFRRASTISFQPKDGTLLLFPSYLMHMVAPHMTDEPRVSVSFNLRVAYADEEKLKEKDTAAQKDRMANPRLRQGKKKAGKKKAGKKFAKKKAGRKKMGKKKAARNTRH